MKKLTLLILIVFNILQTPNPTLQTVKAQPLSSVYANLTLDQNGVLWGKNNEGQPVSLKRYSNGYTLTGVTPKATGSKDGLILQFSDLKLVRSRITYGLIPYGQHTFPSTVMRFSAVIDSSGKAVLNIRRDISDGYDFVGWKKSGKGTVGYRITDPTGLILYEGKQAFVEQNGEIKPHSTLLRGPFISNVSQDSAVIWYDTSEPENTCVNVTGASVHYQSTQPVSRHEIIVKGLQPNSNYTYTVCGAEGPFTYTFRTAPKPGSKLPFTFAYASDSRSGYGGGERNIYGTNAQIMSRIAATAYAQNAGFVQFTGDLVNGYVSEPDDMNLQMANWKHAVEPWWHYMPFNVGMGNHESVGWANESGRVIIDGFPYETHSGQAVFAENFINPLNGPVSEDGSRYDPNPNRPGDFPSYSENVFFYTYGNTAIIVLNSNYWFSPALRTHRSIGGNLHGYIMDEQLRWLEETVVRLEKDKNIKHIFVTIHTPVFPNGGHRGDDMWYDGNNEHRPYVNGQPVEKGIIERRDEFLDICANKSSKVVGFLCGDEHNYNRMVIDDNTPRYPEKWDKSRVKLSRPLLQVINGAAGAPFYAQQQTPWSAAVQGFTVQNALCFFDIKGRRIKLRVINPDTLELIDEADIK